MTQAEDWRAELDRARLRVGAVTHAIPPPLDGFNRAEAVDALQEVDTFMRETQDWVDALAAFSKLLHRAIEDGRFP